MVITINIIVIIGCACVVVSVRLLDCVVLANALFFLEVHMYIEEKKYNRNTTASQGGGTPPPLGPKFDSCGDIQYLKIVWCGGRDGHQDTVSINIQYLNDRSE